MSVIDPKGAAEAYRQGLLDGTWTLEDSRRILAMQDDPTELIDLIKEANKDPAVLTALRKLMPDDDVAKSDRSEKSAGVLIAELLDKLSPDSKCKLCDEESTLEIDHVNGRNWDPAALSRKQRAIKYWEEYDDGVKLQALCRSCNASDGAKNKQEH